MGFGAAALGKRFRVYSLVTLAVVVMAIDVSGLAGVGTWAYLGSDLIP
jgi:hypothetical protein